MLFFSALSKGRGVTSEQKKPQHHRTPLLVAHCTTRTQTPSATDHKKQPETQTLGCGCAKELFHTTTIEKAVQKQAKLVKSWLGKEIFEHIFYKQQSIVILISL